MSRIHTIARTLCLTLACLAPWQAWSASTTPTQEAQALWLAGKREQAIQFVEEALKKTPDEPRLRFALASMLMEQQQLARAKQLFVALTQDHPDLADPYNNLAVIHAAQGDYESARQALVRALDLQPDHAQAQENLGDVLLLRHEDMELLALCNGACAIGPGPAGLATLAAPDVVAAWRVG